MISREHALGAAFALTLGSVLLFAFWWVVVRAEDGLRARDRCDADCMERGIESSEYIDSRCFCRSDGKIKKLW